MEEERQDVDSLEEAIVLICEGHTLRSLCYFEHKAVYEQIQKRP